MDVCVTGRIRFGKEMQREAERGSFFKYMNCVDSVGRREEKIQSSSFSTDSLDTAWRRMLKAFGSGGFGLVELVEEVSLKAGVSNRPECSLKRIGCSVSGSWGRESLLFGCSTGLETEDLSPEPDIFSQASG